ncbi:hypothetical protein DUNSADRAFT_5784 [Dunaliella salina]|uniref:Uncharacterized protein n=1 Tax=Dunaliella salina TaxID=3046 RepID=A0ABQ7GPM0_DUNSA|nr:hypothetical protein DUNSADRAFT_5784 [Dunaliella salina]|eukprot:KAF5836547.1 hypothetical protein DUNSADRAFT_5784 [Dunaliella salina]
MSVKWVMPNGRDPLDHHIYPRVTDWAQLQNAPLQGPLDTVYLVSSESCSVGLDFSIARGPTVPDSPPPVPGSGPVLMKRLDVGVSADIVELYHDAQDVDDPSDFVVLRLTSAFYSSSFSYFPTTRVVELSNRTYTRPTKRKVMTALTVEARNLQLSQTLPNHPQGPRKGTAKATSTAGSWGRGGSGPNPDLEFGKGLILSATCLMLKQAPQRHSGAMWGEHRSSSDRRPMRIVVQDVQLLSTSRLRDVCVATATHLMTAFSSQKPAPKPSSFLSKQDRERAEQQRQAKQGSRGTKKESGGAAGTGARNMARVRTMGRAPEPARDVMLRDEEVLLRQLVEAHKQRALTTPSAAQLRLGQEGEEDGGNAPPDAPTPTANPLSPIPTLPELSRQTSAGSKSLHRSSSSGDRSMPRSESLKRIVEGLQLVLEVEFKRLQISLVPENCPGSLLLSTDAAVARLQRAPETGERRLELTMDHLQAYASRPQRTKSGACAPVSLPWLQPAKPAPDAGSLSRAGSAQDDSGQDSHEAAPPPGDGPGQAIPPSNANVTAVPATDSGSGRLSSRRSLGSRFSGGGAGSGGYEDKGTVGSPLGPKGSGGGGMSSIRVRPSPPRRASPKHRRMLSK